MKKKSKKKKKRGLRLTPEQYQELLRISETNYLLYSNSGIDLYFNSAIDTFNSATIRSFLRRGLIKKLYGHACKTSFDILILTPLGKKYAEIAKAMNKF